MTDISLSPYLTGAMWGQAFWPAAALSGGVAAKRNWRKDAARKGGGSPKGLTPPKGLKGTSYDI